MPVDPVLRWVLINKGILTMDDITEAENQITALTGGIVQIVRDFEGEGPKG
jgi:hypothetical protein